MTYTYDVYGKRTTAYNSNLTTPMGILMRQRQMMADLCNPFGYRGYCYDAYTGLYYLQSRYYDPDTGRFINADSTDYLNATGTVLGCNLFIYCENDPVNNVDPTGMAYSANSAINYAKKWWNSYNTLYYHYFSGGDCTNFVSQCLYAGGLKMDSTWYSKRSNRYKKGWDMQLKVETVRTGFLNLFYRTTLVPYWFSVSRAWSLASGLYYYLRYDKKFSFRKYDNATSLKKHLKEGKIKKGSVVFFEDNGCNIHHAVIIGKVTKSDAYYYAHSSNRNADKGLVSVLNGNKEQCIYVFEVR